MSIYDILCFFLAITSIPTTTAKSIISGIISSAQIEIKLDADFDDALADTGSWLIYDVHFFPYPFYFHLQFLT